MSLVPVTAQGDPAEIIRRTIQSDRRLAGWTPKDLSSGTTPASGWTKGYTYASQALARYGGPHVPHIMLKIEKYNAPEEAAAGYDRVMQTIQQKQLEVSAQNFGVGSRSTLHKYYEITRQDGTPVGRPAYQVDAVGDGWLLKVSVYNRLDESVVDDLTAGRTARGVAETIFGLIQPAASPDPPRIHSVQTRVQHISRTHAAISVIAHVRYPQAAGDPRPGDVLVTLHLDNQAIQSAPGDAAFSATGHEIRTERVLTTDKTGRLAIRVDLLDRRYSTAANPALAYEDRFRTEVEVETPSAEIKGVSGIVSVIRKNAVTRKDGVLLVRDAPARPAGERADAEPIHSAWLYDGDQVVLADTGQRVSRSASGEVVWPTLSSIDLEWNGGVRGQAIHRPGRYTEGDGRFTVGTTRGLSGEVSNRWGRNLRDYEILFTQEVVELAEGMADDEFSSRHELPNLVDWLLERTPGFGSTLTTINQYGVFSWHAGDTVLSDIQYLELKSKVHIKSEPGARLKIYVLEGNPVLHPGRGTSRIDLRPGQVATCAPTRPATTAAFDPAQLERVWETVRYVSWGKAGSGEPRQTSDPSGTTEPNAPLDLDLAEKIMQGLLREPAADIPSLQAKVTGVRFYEGGFDGIPMEQRTYAARFRRSAARSIWWELSIAYPDPGRRIDFSVEAVYYRPDGTILNRYVLPCFIQSPWTSTYHSTGFGGKEPGTWLPGVYRVELFIAGQKVAAGSFEIAE